MTDLWSGLALLTLLALAFVALPLFRAARLHRAQTALEAEDGQSGENVRLYRRERQAIEFEREQGELTEDEAHQRRLELDTRLLEETETTQRAALGAPARGRWLVALAALLLVAGSGVTYLSVGSADNLALYDTAQTLKATPEATLSDYIEALEPYTETQADNPRVWETLFPLYRQASRFGDAEHALERIIALGERTPELVALRAQMRYFDHGMQLDDTGRTLLDDALARAPDNPTANSLAGLVAFHGADYAQAIDRWQTAAARYQEPGSVRAMQEGIRIARERAGLTAEAQHDAKTQRAPKAQAASQVDVAIASRIDGDVPDATTVFIIARDPTTPDGPPLAVKRLTYAQLPAEVTLTDRDAMAPALVLSSASTVEVQARLSRSGNAAPQPGDWVSDTQRVAVSDAPAVRLTIDHRLDSDGGRD
ncbi:c-type cytochrome biogenesis protein CcmI [Larsenimonas suaedae]|uniref:C-type cytochrome biogenesis protein CcmI n=1 Tax=Larsenimonas suaedae TaxID=1851019 RepID=A0ABU1GW33_9GAMM|nr:c-type cytochrome biogenesis protein CcmI [Larsenimonas suaedae]MCM2971976.1 c-type cytochrome biogenesis protein CcmI [Larsenimonas suaedae]MDR5895528.1 c-type cytochrome biogenesis protein CcmI [Larsenimonas suaedae]